MKELYSGEHVQNKVWHHPRRIFKLYRFTPEQFLFIVYVYSTCSREDVYCMVIYLCIELHCVPRKGFGSAVNDTLMTSFIGQYHLSIKIYWQIISLNIMGAYWQILSLNIMGKQIKCKKTDNWLCTWRTSWAGPSLPQSLTTAQEHLTTFLALPSWSILHRPAHSPSFMLEST